ncbi:MAG: CDP-alcohol phosphatidyltransferase family protein [Flavobacteriales bacterium]|nr:CDP-alcohol phosphatidyltransferase family protein [Flavobacteriales bacterium]
MTLANLLSGCTGIAIVSMGYFRLGALCVILSALLDFFDGLAARAFKAQSVIGKDLDSLADVVSFGVLPSFMIFSYLKVMDQAVNIDIKFTNQILTFQLINLSVFVMAGFSALRLARFNHDPGQQTSFKGLPTPANGLFWAAMFMGLFFSYSVSKLDFHQPDANQLIEAINAEGQIFLWKGLFKNKISLIVMTFFMSLLLIAPFRLISFKLNQWNWQKNKFIYLFIFTSVILIIYLGFEAAPFILILYIIFSILTFRKSFLT